MSLYFTALYYSDIRNIISRLFSTILPYWEKGLGSERRVHKPWEDAEINHITLEKSSGLRIYRIYCNILGCVKPSWNTNIALLLEKN